MKGSHKQLKEYFLGSLDKKASEYIGVQIISDPSFEDQLMIAENELMEDFLEKNLTPAEEKLFYSNFLICEDRVNDLKALSLLKSYARSISQTEDLSNNSINPIDSFWTTLKNAFSNHLRPATAILSLILILFLGGLIWIYLKNSGFQPTQLEQEYAQLNQKDLSNLSDYSNYTNLGLISVTLRDASVSPKLNVSNATEKVFFRLPLPIAVADKDLLNIEVLSNQKSIFTQQKIQIYQNQNGQEVRLLLPKSILNNGQYQIKLINPNSNLAPIIYTFAVE